jgi:hypothetical protein
MRCLTLHCITSSFHRFNALLLQCFIALMLHHFNAPALVRDWLLGGGELFYGWGGAAGGVGRQLKEWQHQQSQFPYVSLVSKYWITLIATDPFNTRILCCLLMLVAEYITDSCRWESSFSSFANR